MLAWLLNIGDYDYHYDDNLTSLKKKSTDIYVDAMWRMMDDGLNVKAVANMMILIKSNNMVNMNMLPSF